MRFRWNTQVSLTPRTQFLFLSVVATTAVNFHAPLGSSHCTRHDFNRRISRHKWKTLFLLLQVLKTLKTPRLYTLFLPASFCIYQRHFVLISLSLHPVVLLFCSCPISSLISIYRSSHKHYNFHAVCKRKLLSPP